MHWFPSFLHLIAFVLLGFIEASYSLWFPWIYIYNYCFECILWNFIQFTLLEDMAVGTTAFEVLLSCSYIPLCVLMKCMYVQRYILWHMCVSDCAFMCVSQSQVSFSHFQLCLASGTIHIVETESLINLSWPMNSTHLVVSAFWVWWLAEVSSITPGCVVVCFVCFFKFFLCRFWRRNSISHACITRQQALHWTIPHISCITSFQCSCFNLSLY